MLLAFLICLLPSPCLSCAATSSTTTVTTTTTTASSVTTTTTAATTTTVAIACDIDGPTVIMISDGATDFESIVTDTTTDPATKSFTCTGPAADSITVISFNQDAAGTAQDLGTVTSVLTCGTNGFWQLQGVDITEVECQVF